MYLIPLKPSPKNLLLTNLCKKRKIDINFLKYSYNILKNKDNTITENN
jgi:hypothetical protein